MDIVILILNNVNIIFIKQKLISRLYIPAKTLQIIQRVQIIKWKKIAAVALNLSKKFFIIYLTDLKAEILIFSVCVTQIGLIIAKNIIILDEYLDLSNIFSKKLVVKLFKHYNISKHLINQK